MTATNAGLDYAPTWCVGCGNYGILTAWKKAMGILEIDLEKVALVTGIGCGSKIGQYVNTYRIETLHGRTLPVASGIKLANHELTVIAEGGEGDGMGLGMGHFIHSARRNLDLSYFIHNNQIYALTKGQASPTTDRGTVTKFTPPPLGNVEQAVNIVQLALSAGASFVARGSAANIDQLAQLMAEAVRHRGFAVLDILQPCVSFNLVNTYQWYKERALSLESVAGYDATDRNQALEFASLWGEKIPLGVFYRSERATFSDSLPQLEKGTLVAQALDDIDVTALMRKLG